MPAAGRLQDRIGFHPVSSANDSAQCRDRVITIFQTTNAHLSYSSSAAPCRVSPPSWICLKWRLKWWQTKKVLPSRSTAAYQRFPYFIRFFGEDFRKSIWIFSRTYFRTNLYSLVKKPQGLPTKTGDTKRKALESTKRQRRQLITNIWIKKKFHEISKANGIYVGCVLWSKLVIFLAISRVV